MTKPYAVVIIAALAQLTVTAREKTSLNIGVLRSFYTCKRNATTLCGLTQAVVEGGGKQRNRMALNAWQTSVGRQTPTLRSNSK